MLTENYTSPSASGLKDVEGNGISHPVNRQDVRVSNMGTISISLPNAIMMLIEMAKYSDHINLEFDVWSEEYKCEVKLK